MGKIKEHKNIHCESKNTPPTGLRFSDNFSQTVEIFKINFYTPITRSYLR